MRPGAMTRIPRGARWLRAGLSAGLVLLLVAVALSARIPHPPALTMPCGFHALTGLPCLFCGGTRAVRAVLSGQWELALYLNPIAYPAVLAALLLASLFFCEAVLGIALWNSGPWAQRLCRLAPLLIVAGLAWWAWHVVSALKTPKPELVNFKNPVAAKLAEILKSSGH